MTPLSLSSLFWRTSSLPTGRAGKTWSAKSKTGLYRLPCGQVPTTGIGVSTYFGSHLLQPIPAFRLELGPLGTRWYHWRGRLWTRAWKLSRKPTFKRAIRRPAWCIVTWRRSVSSYGRSFSSISVYLLPCSRRVSVVFECNCLGPVVLIALTFICRCSISCSVPCQFIPCK